MTSHRMSFNSDQEATWVETSRDRAPIWDEHALDDMRAIGGDPLVKRVAAQALRDVEDRIVELRESTSPRLRDWRETAHALYGIALSMGATRLGILVVELLACESAVDWENHVAQITTCVEELREAVAQCQT